MGKIQAPKGTKDMLHKDAYKWHYIENKLRKLSEEYGIREIRTPMFESTELFLRGVGETTDVVQKEMYTFLDKGNRSITLKPEGTAPAVRAFIENSVYADTQPTKLYYFTPCFRYEKMQKGRLREFHQYGIEIFGSKEATVDAEVISLAMRALDEFGIKGLDLHINSLGCPHCRAKFHAALKEFLKENYDGLCETCKTRYEKNPMRILDCKVKSCKEITKNAPNILEFLCEECNTHFENLKGYLDAINIKYTIDPKIVRGLDYYSKTVFEIMNNDITICGGGRYDYMIGEMGGPETPAIGFGLGLERLLLTLEDEGIEIPEPNYMDIYIGSIGEEAKVKSFAIAYDLRKLGIKCECDHMARGVKPQMKYANKINAAYTMILGGTEIENKVATLKRMSDGETFNVNIDSLEEIKNIVK